MLRPHLPSLPPSHPRSPTLSIATAPKLNSPVSCLLGSDSCTTHPGMRVSMYLVPGLKDISLPLKIWSHTIKPSLPVKSIRFFTALPFSHLFYSPVNPGKAFSSLHYLTITWHFIVPLPKYCFPFPRKPYHMFTQQHVQRMRKRVKRDGVTAECFLSSHHKDITHVICSSVWLLCKHAYIYWFSSFIFPRTWSKSAGLLDNF